MRRNLTEWERAKESDLMPYSESPLVTVSTAEALDFMVQYEGQFVNWDKVAPWAFARRSIGAATAIIGAVAHDFVLHYSPAFTLDALSNVYVAIPIATGFAYGPSAFEQELQASIDRAGWVAACASGDSDDSMSAPDHVRIQLPPAMRVAQFLNVPLILTPPERSAVDAVAIVRQAYDISMPDCLAWIGKRAKDRSQICSNILLLREQPQTKHLQQAVREVYRAIRTQSVDSAIEHLKAAQIEAARLSEVMEEPATIRLRIEDVGMFAQGGNASTQGVNAKTFRALLVSPELEVEFLAEHIERTYNVPFNGVRQQTIQLLASR